jgi:hypothetical protein
MKGPTVTVKAMSKHVTDLCSKHQIVCNYRCRRPSEAWSAREWEEICISPIKSSLSYATALHEIGHILGRHQLGSKSMVREHWAWKWAKSNALIWTPTMAQHAGAALGFAAGRQSQ